MRTRFYLIVLAVCSFCYPSFAQKQPYDLQKSIARGAEIYATQCMSCHMQEGEGIPEVYPPLAGSDYLMAGRARSIDNVLHGLSGDIVVNGKTYSMEMMSFPHLSDEEVADVVNYIRNSWGNSDETPVTPDEVKNLRK